MAGMPSVLENILHFFSFITFWLSLSGWAAIASTTAAAFFGLDI